jgi:group I intron endonuclease
MNYYVYALLDPTKIGQYSYSKFSVQYQPFYIGKGYRLRATIHCRKSMLHADNHKNRKIRKLLNSGKNPIIFYIKKNLSEKDAYLLETQIIDEIGLALLTNVYPGGSGAQNNKNFFGKKHTIEAKEKMRDSKLGSNNPMYGENWKRSELGKKRFSEKMAGSKHPNFGKLQSLETKNKISKKLKGIKLSDTDRENRQVSMLKVWESRKEKGTVIKNRRNSIKILAVNLITNQSIQFSTQKNCCDLFNINYRTLKKCINSNQLINDFNLTKLQ